MSNCAYLCSTDDRRIYPSSRDGYDSDVQTIAMDVNCVPLMWLAMFRASDVIVEDFGEERTPYIAEAPIARRTDAARQLQRALPYLNTVFAREGRLDGYVRFLQSAVHDAVGEYITIEMEEIACLSETFYDDFRAALAGLGKDTSIEAKARLVAISGLRALKPFPLRGCGSTASPPNRMMSGISAASSGHPCTRMSRGR